MPPSWERMKIITRAKQGVSTSARYRELTSHPELGKVIR